MYLLREAAIKHSSSVIFFPFERERRKFFTICSATVIFIYNRIFCIFNICGPTGISLYIFFAIFCTYYNLRMII